jgi:AsmA protein
MQDLNAKIRYANQTATIEQLSAGVEQFNLGALGKVDLGKQSLDVQLPVQFSQPLTQRQGCPATSSWLVGKALSLVRCKGSLLEPTQACGLDDRAIREAVKDYAEAKAKAKVDAKKDEAKQRLDEKKDRLKDKIDEELGEGASDLLKDLFKRD